MRWIVTVVGIMFGFWLHAQETEPVENQILIEDATEQLGEETDFEFNTQFENLAIYLDRPLNLNRASETELADLGLLNPLQIQAFLKYRTTLGDLVSIYELQAVPNFDLMTIKKILPYVGIGNEYESQKKLLQRFRGGQSNFFIRYQRVLEERKGYVPALHPDESRYLGDPNALYLRFNYNFNQQLSYGLTAEKDAGEPFGGENRAGFDYYSAHFFATNPTKRLKNLALGDFQLRFGQGLVIWTGFGFAKSAFTMSVKRIGRTVSPYTSVNEANFLRGAAATLQISKTLDFTAFASYRQRDANITAFDTINEIPEEISSLQITGLHRTANEMADKNAVSQFTTGGNLQWRHRFGEVGMNALWTTLDAPLTRSDALYNKYRFAGQRLFNASIDYTFLFKNFHFFGETALSDNGGWATLNGLLFAASRTVDFALLQRHFRADYQTLFGNAFAETVGVQNESGVYLGVQIQPSRAWLIKAYFDQWRHPWLRFGVDAPSRGSEQLLQLDYSPRRGTLFYLRYRSEKKEQNAVANETPMDFLVFQHRRQLRLHAQSQLTPSLTLKSRVEFSRNDNGSGTVSNGFLVYQDLQYKLEKWSFTMRFAVFDTDDFDSRIYAYENDLLYNFSIPAYYYKGTRFYLNFKHRLNRNLTLEGRFAQTRYSNRKTVGSGLEEIEGNSRSEVKFQLRWKF